MAARRVNAMEKNSENSDIIYIGELKSVNELDAKEINCVLYEKILVNKNAVMFKLDTGSQVNVIPKLELLKWDEKPVQPRKVPLAIYNKAKEELSNMVETGIISKVEPTEWVSNMVVIDSPKKLRICLDPRPLNEAIQRSNYPIPTVDALITKLQGVLPFGLNSAPEEFQKAMDEIYEKDEDINPYFDDIALGSSTVEEHCRLLRRTLLKVRKANLKFNVLKTQLSQTLINYLGHVLSDEGIKPDPKKIRAIEEFATLNCKDLKRFLGMVTYLAKFTPHLSNLTHNLRQLLKKDSVWIWDTNTERDFELVKQAIMKFPCLKYFNGNKAVTVSVDASKNGLGAVLLQDGQPVAYGSVSITQTQQHCAQIEKELMAVIYGLEHFNYYTYGRIVTVQTVHKSILGLSKKAYNTISPRLQRILLRLNKYNIQLE
ncbi:transposon Tf2-6 polyprotein [Trichonephila clavipes]|nr:transposon Tf2-6 polyprotein [Trichonephila clavipes]